MEESSRRAAVALASPLLHLPPCLPLDDDEPWWVLPSASGGGDEIPGFTVLGGAPAAATPLAAMLRRIASSTGDSTSSSFSVVPLSHADAALAIRLFEKEPEQSIAACQSLLERGGGQEALTRVAKASPSLAAAAAAAAAAATTEPLPAGLSLFEASPLAAAWIEAFLKAPVTLQWAEAASRLASRGAPSSSAVSSPRPPPLTETNLLPPASFARSAVSRALHAAQTQQKQQEQQQQLQQQRSPSVPAALGAVAAATPTTAELASEAETFAAVRLAVALARSLLRSPGAPRRALSDPASRLELEAFCLASARSRDATDLYRDLKNGAAFR